MKQFMEKTFRISDHNTSIRTEILAGVTTFLTMAYIIFVQPAVLSTDFAGKPTGLDYGAVLLATCITSAIATIFMGLYARYPIALAPGMGENFFFVSVIMALSTPALGFVAPWRVALGIVFISGIIFMLLSILRVRQVDYSEAIPAFFIILGIPLTYLISDGLALGFISYPLIKLLGGKGCDVKGFMYVLGVLLVFYFIFVRARMYA